jgi:hypothetical protein
MCLNIEFDVQNPSYYVNQASYDFNRKWEPTLANLQASLPGSTIVYSDIYNIDVQQCCEAAHLSCLDAYIFIYILGFCIVVHRLITDSCLHP